MPYLERRQIRVQVVDATLVNDADIVFQSVERDWQARFCQRREQGGGQINFSLRAPDDTRWRDKPRCLSESGVIVRNEPIASILMQVEHALALPVATGAMHRRCYWCEQQRITLRERDVMRYMAREIPPTAIARYLRLNVKTVSHHKLAVMRKLGFKRNVDLYHWLRLGGLETVAK